MIRAVVTDIEGTTSSLSFVKDVLFPYARDRLPGYVRAHAEEPEVARLLDAVRDEAGDRGLSVEQCIGQLQHWIDEDAKVTPLKSLQGLVWEAGYRQGDFRGHVYPDAVEVLRRWHAAGLGLYVYSSGSVQAQKLLFGHTEYGDLTGLFQGFFDTQTGGKKEGSSYRRIAEAIGYSELLFLSDDVRELNAAEGAGWRAVQLVRPGEAQPPGAHPTAEDFYGIDLERLDR